MPQKAAFSLACLIFFTFILSYNAWAWPIPDSGQDTCYDDQGNEITCPSPGEPFYGQDANYSINPRSYTKLDAQGNTLPGSATEWAMVKDDVTGLIWEAKTGDGGIHDKDDKYNWQGAQDAFITELNKQNFGGHADWRMPTHKELASLADLGTYSPAIDTSYFPNTASLGYWSSTTYANDEDYAWRVSFSYGNDGSNSKSLSYYVRAVRGGQSGSFDDLIIHGDGTVTDPNSGLTWQRATAENQMTWSEALDYCENLNLAGHNDWRLPTREELRSIVNYDAFNPAIDEQAFPNTASSLYWSSTTHANYENYAWHVYFDYGRDYNKYKSLSYYVRAVRTRDATSPVISGLSNSTMPTQEKTWAWPANENATYRYAVNQNTSFEFNSAVSFNATNSTSLSGVDGTWYLHVQAKDLADNLSEVKTVSAMLDNTAPVVIGLSNQTEPEQEIDMSWSANENATFRYAINKEQSWEASSNFTATHSTTISNKDGNWYLHVQAKDQAGNIGKVKTVQVHADNTAPDNSDLVVAGPKNFVNSTANGFNLNSTVWTEYEYKLDDGEWKGPFAITKNASLTDLKEGNHTLYLLGADQAGNWQKAEEAFKYTWQVDTTSPQIFGIQNSTTPVKSTNWTWNSNEQAKYRFVVDQNKFWSPAGDFSNSSKAVKENVDGTWYLHVQAKDRAGNKAQKSVFAVLDNTPPTAVISPDPESPTKQTSANFTVSGSEVAGYKFLLNEGNFTENEYALDALIKLANLADGQQELKVIARDSLGNWQSKSNPSVKTWVVDTTSPELTGLANSTQPLTEKNWTWQATENATFRYGLNQQPTWQANGNFTNNTEAELEGMQGTWYLHVQAKDQAGNIGPVESVYSIMIRPQAKSSLAIRFKNTENLMPWYQAEDSLELKANYMDKAGDSINLASMAQFGVQTDWESTDTDVATVEEGKVTFHQDGAVRILATAGGLSASYAFQVGKMESDKEKQYGNLIILAGGDPTDTNDDLAPAIQYLSQRMYRIFSARGFHDEDIFYINHQTVDLDGDGLADGIVDEQEKSVANLEQAITWADTQTNQGPLYVYLIDHGEKNGSFLVGDQEILTAGKLDAMLDGFDPQRQVVVILEACYSGSFLEALKAENRVVIASSSAGNYSYHGSNGSRSFSQFLSNALFQGKNWKNAFDQAVSDLNSLGNPYALMQPQASFGAGITQQKVYGDFAMAGLFPELKNMTKGTAVDAGTEQDFSITVDMLDVSGVEVWATVTPPNYEPPSVSGNFTTPGDQLKTFDFIQSDQSKTFSGSYTFTKNGEYEVIYYAKDTQGNVVATPPEVFTVSGGSNGTNWTVTQNWNLLSLPLIPESASPADIFGENWEDVVSLWKWGNGGWMVALPSMSQDQEDAYQENKGFASINEVTSGQGFWVNAVNQFQLSIQGEAPVNTFPDVHSGWNLVGLCGNSTKTVDQLVEAIDLDVQSIWKWPEGEGSWKVCLPGEDDNGTSYAESKGFGVMESIEPGEGFWVNCQ